jgi:dienelactone hydrolase
VLSAWRPAAGPRRRIGLGAAALLGASLLVGCRSVIVPLDPPTAADPADAERGGVRVQTGSLRSSAGCTIAYDLYRRSDDAGPVSVVLAHGFLRDKARMAGLAERLAAAGMATVAIDLCNMRPWDGGHRQNAADMRRVAAGLGGPAVLYAGFSAGGLAALLAASDDPRSAGVLAMDLVDQDRLGERAAATLRRPIVGLVGEASRCNARNNGLAVLAAAEQAEILRFSGASHCDFEAPSDGLCRLICEPADRSPVRSAEIRSQIIDAAVTAARRLLSAQR